MNTTDTDLANPIAQKNKTFQKFSEKFQDDYEKTQSILLKISLVYLLTTSIVLSIFLVASSSNQMGLIAEKAVKTTDVTAYELFRRLQPLFKGSKWSLKKNSKKNQRSINKIEDSLRIFEGSDRLIVPNFKIISTNGGIFHQYNQLSENKIEWSNSDQDNNPNKASSSVLKKLKRAVSSKEIKEQPFLGIPNIKKYYVEIILPMNKFKGENILFYTRLSIKSLEKEVSSIMRLAFSLIGLVLLTQFALVYFLYRVLLIPIKKLAEGAHNVAEGDLTCQIPQLKQADELGQLTYLFNKMVFALYERTLKLNSIIVELQKRNELMQNELEMARNIQTGIMPYDFVYEKIEFSIYYAPLEKVSGDYYDFFVLPNGSLGMLMTDASGHGVPAALVTIMAKVHFNDAVGRFEQPGELLEYINGRLVESIITSDYMTAFYMILDADRKLRYSNASHQKAIIFRHETKEVLELDSGGFFIGAIKDVPFTYENKELQLYSEDRVILYTDGIVEGMNHKQEEYGNERFIERIKEFAHLGVQDFKDKIVHDISLFAEGAPRRDDYTLLVIRIK